MRTRLIIVFALASTSLIGQKAHILGKLEKPAIRVSWVERQGHSGIPVWTRLSELFFADSISGQRVHDSIAVILSFDLIVYDEKDDKDSAVYHILNTGFAKKYSRVARKMIPGTYVVITNILCRIKWMTQGDFFYRPKEDEILVFRNQ